ncbi:hypothetical protein GOL22_27150 [Sinorhizobium medicae]|nr:hypothetical protein [Sinorhizobium medicae]
MNEQAEVKKLKRWYSHPLIRRATSLLMKSGILASACFLALYIAIRTSAVLDAPIVSVRNDKSSAGGIEYKLPLRIEYVRLAWDIEACEFDPAAQVFNVAMLIAKTTESKIIADPTVSYRIEQKSLLNWAFSSSTGIKFSDNGFIQEFILNSVGDVIENFVAQPTSRDFHVVQVPPQTVPGLTSSAEDQCGASVVAALKLKQAAKTTSDRDRQSVIEATADHVLSYSDTRQIIPRFDGLIKAEGTGLVQPFPDSQRFGPVMKLAAARLSVDIKLEAVESGQAPAEQAPASAEGIIFRVPGLAAVTLCIGRCQPNKFDNVELSSIEEFPQLGSYTVIPAVRRPFSTLAVAINADDQGRLKAIHLGEKQRVPGERPETPKEQSNPNAFFDEEPPPAAPAQD